MTLREELRAKTSHLHGQAEAALDLMNPSMSLKKYLPVLGLLHDFYSEVEPAILSQRGFLALGLEMGARRKLPLLAADLDFLEATSRSPRAARAIQAPSLALDSFSAALGAAYVVEGATLGGAIIYRHLTLCLGLSGGEGARFFDCYGSETGPRWKQFVEALGRAPFDEEERGQACAGAIHTFELLLRRARSPRPLPAAVLELAALPRWAKP